MRAFLAGCCLLLAASAGAGKDPVYALVGARVVPVSGPAQERATVVLRDGLIEALGAELEPPPDARVIDAEGWTLTPGLIDGFGGVGLPRPRAKNDGGERPAGPGPDPLAPAARALDRLDVKQALKAREAGVTTALVAAPEGVLPGQSVLINLAGDSAEAMVLRQPAALTLHMATLSGGRYPGSLMGTVALARQSLLDAARYRLAWTAWERTPRGLQRPAYDAGLEVWQEVAAGRLPLMVTAPRENDVRRALGLADELGVRVAVAGARFAHRLVRELARRKPPLLVSVRFDPPEPVPLFGTPDEEKERAEIEEAKQGPAKLHAAGVPFALVSGHGEDFLAGVRTAVENGLPREAALEALTLGAARALGVDDRLGSLEPGKIANLLAWEGEPLGKDAKLKLVFVDGRLHEPEPREEKNEDTAPPEPKEGRP